MHSGQTEAQREPVSSRQGVAARPGKAARAVLRAGRYMVVVIVGALVLAGCVPQAAPAAESEKSAKVGAIQTRVAETRAELTAAGDESMAGPGGEPASVEESKAGPTAQQLDLLARLRPQGEAPELFNEVWLNSEPLRLVDLRGQVVLIEFWTYG